MMEAERAEEREVLQSIYEGDTSFSQVEDNLFQYKYNEGGENKNFVLEIRWVGNYPEEAPEINMDIFYNKHIMQEVKDGIVSSVKEQAQDMLGMSMTFTLIEWLKDNYEPFMVQQEQLAAEARTAVTTEITARTSSLSINGNPESTKTAKKKTDGMSKNQKRRMWDRQNAAGEKDRGYDWVDVVKHLSQTGGGTTC
uniref:RWD domain-containing protein 4-like n=1 Tax=Hirondellea gigas TaxID=1518452 RepID=A0A2P2I160_9CRUS